MARTWQVWAHIDHWIDGDTFSGWTDLGCHIYLGTWEHPIRFRCALINAPELSTGAPGAAATTYARSLAPAGDYPATSTGLDNYGRPLLDIRLPDGSLFSERMLQSGHAVRYER